MKKVLIVLFALLFLCTVSTSHAAYPTTTEHHKVYPYTSIMASPYSCDPTGVVNIAAALEQLKANQSNVGTIHIPKGTFKLSTAFTLPIGMTLRFEAGSTLAISADVTINGCLEMLSGGLITIATTKTLTLNGPLEARLYQIFSWSGTGKVVFGPAVTGEIYPEWWGAKADGVINSTAAITAAWNALQGSTQYFGPDAENQANQIVRGPILKFSQGKYLFNGTALTSADVYRSVRLQGCGSGLTKIVNQGDTYFISVAKATGYWEISGIHFYGGKGVFKQADNLVDVGAEFWFHDNWCVGYTECAVGFNASDKPYVRINNNTFQAAASSASIGIAMPPKAGGNEIYSNNFVRNKYHIKLRDGGGAGTTIFKNSFLRLDTTIDPCHDLWVVPMTHTNYKSGLFVTANKFGNESLGANDFRVLVADEDAIGADNLAKHHVITASTGYFEGARFQANDFIGNLTWTKSYITAFTPNVGNLYWDNLLDGTLPTYFLEFDAIVTMTDNNSYSRDSLFINAQSPWGRSQGKPKISNINGVGWLIDPYVHVPGMIGYPQQYPGSGRNVGYVKLLAADAIRTNGILTDCTRGNQTDSLGGTNAITLTFTAYTGDFALGADHASAVVGKLVYLEFDVKVAGATPLTTMEARITITGGKDYWEVRRLINIPSVWTRVRIPFVARQNTALVLRFLAGDYAAGTKVAVDIGRPSVYHANEPENIRFNSGSFTVTLNVATTAVTDARATTISKIVITPTAATSAAEVATTYISAKALGSFTVTHPNNATAGRTWDYHLDN